MEKHCVILKQVDYATELTGGIVKMVANNIIKASDAFVKAGKLLMEKNHRG